MLRTWLNPLLWMGTLLERLCAALWSLLSREWRVPGWEDEGTQKLHSNPHSLTLSTSFISGQFWTRGLKLCTNLLVPELLGEGCWVPSLLQ